MSKRLILILALAFVVGITFTAYAEVQNVKVSGDLNVLGISRDLDLKHGKDNSGSYGRTSGIATITRVKVDADLTDNVATTVRLLNERYWGTETENTGSSNASNTNISLDLAYVALKEFLYSPLSLTVGRQELNIGSGMILGDPETNNAVTAASAFSNTVGTTINGDPDLSARKAFDAIRATLNYDPLVVDVIYAKINASGTKTNQKDDEGVFGVNANYKLNKATTIEGYLFEKRIGKDRVTTSGAPNKVQRTDVIGGRVVNTSLKDLLLSLEVAHQFGTYSDTLSNTIQSRSAWAVETAANYTFSKVKYVPSVTALYSYFSGDNDGPAGTGYRGNKAWDPMYENQKSGDIANALFNQTNAHILGGIASVKPMDDVTLKGEYYAYWWAKPYDDGQVITSVRGNNLTTTERRFAGQELDVTGTYDYTEDVSFSLMGGCFFPGPSFAKQTTANINQKKIASEMIGSMKVTF
jgi:hypothetical protein